MRIFCRISAYTNQFLKLLLTTYLKLAYIAGAFSLLVVAIIDLESEGRLGRTGVGFRAERRPRLDEIQQKEVTHLMTRTQCSIYLP